MAKHLLALTLIITLSSWAHQTLVNSYGRLEESLAAAGAVATAPARVRLVAPEAPPDLRATAYAVGYLPADGDLEIVVEKAGDFALPIASITKLMTARLAASGDHSEIITIAPADQVWPTDFSQFRSGDQLTRDGLLQSLLIESSNYAAAALARQGGDDFVRQMNREAKKLGLSETAYYNPSGLDPASLGGADLNRSTAQDLLKLAKTLWQENPSLMTITRQPSAALYAAAGGYHHTMISTNRLLGATRWPAEVVGGKTGQTDLAEKNLLLILENQQGGGHLLAVVLGSPDHFGEMTTLLDWVYRTDRCH